MNINRSQAWEILNKYVESESLIKHSLAVEAAMEHFAEVFEEDRELWGIIGLLHDIDYEKYPDEHCSKVFDIFEKEGLPREYSQAISSHGYGILDYVKREPESKMEKTLYMVDELTGLVIASVLVRPSKSILDIKPKSVKKKWKDSSFAKNISRKTIDRGLEYLEMDRTYAIEETIEALKKACDQLDLRGEIQS